MAKKTPKLPKTQKAPEPEPPAPKSKRGGKQSNPATPPNESSAQTPAKPRALVAPPSWTGKLPVTLLHEHCQKLGWNKVEYVMKNERMGCLATATLSWTNPKTHELETVRLTPPVPEGYKPTAVEARHQCAVYCLHRIASHKNLQHVLPPEHRLYWQHLETVRKQDIQAGKDYKYQPDPFLAKKQHEARLKQMEAQRAEAEAKKQADEERGIIRNEGKDKKWDASPVVDMGLTTRRTIERVIRSHYQWSRQPMPSQPKDEIVNRLSGLGFRRSHVEEACEFTKDEEETLEWLLIYVPEDDLPARFLPRDYATGLSILAPTAESLALDFAADRLSRAGYPMETCRQMLLTVNGDEFLASETLFRHLLSVAHDDADDVPKDIDHWVEEQAPLKEIYTSRFTVLSSTTCRIKLCPPESRVLPNEISIELERSKSYPYGLPPHIVVLSEPKLPAHVRLSLIRQAGLYAWESLRGSEMVYGIADWLEENIERIIKHPGRLSDLDGVVSAEETNIPVRDIKAKDDNMLKTRKIDWTPRAVIDEGPVSTFRKSLPAWKHRDEVISIAQKNRVVVITGETGSGKSTQIPQFLLDDLISRGLSHAANIVCTQPRRISAIGLADRVSEERNERVGMTVGYSIRGESRTGRNTKLQFVTTGVLLRRFLANPELSDVSHVIVDEVHERTVDGDFLLLLLKQLLIRRTDLTIVLMSATVEADDYTRYFSDFKVGHVHIEGRTFPVQDVYLEDILGRTGYRLSRRNVKQDPETEADDFEEGVGTTLKILNEGKLDYELIAKTVDLVCEKSQDDGGILIFLPGIAEIFQCINAINSLDCAKHLQIIPLHASLPPQEQKRVFSQPPIGMRKVIVSTNVAETSITIDDITLVIDTGKVKQLTYNPNTNIACLEEQWTSRASAKQRRGRAGRVAPGTCYKLFSKLVERSKMDERTTPEIQRIPLEQLCLLVLGMGWNDVIGVLSKTLSPPKIEALERAMRILKDIGALDGESLSALGRHMSAIPADLRCSKLMILGSIFGCLSATLTIASIIAVKSPFISPSDKRDVASEARKRFSDGSGDLLTDAKAFNAWSAMLSEKRTRLTRKWCDENFLSFSTLSDIASTRMSFISALHEAGLIPSTSTTTVANLSRYSSDDALVRSLVATALYPNIARIVLPATKYEKLSSGSLALDPEARSIKFFTLSETSEDRDERVFIHPGSTLFTASSFIDNCPFTAYFIRVQTSKVFLRDVTPVSALAILLLCGEKVEIDHLGRGVKIKGLRVKAWARIGTLIAILRRLLDERLRWKIENPDIDILEDSVVVCLRNLIQDR